MMVATSPGVEERMSRVDPTSSSFPSGDTPRKVIILRGITSVIVALILLESRMMFGRLLWFRDIL